MSRAHAIPSQPWRVMRTSFTSPQAHAMPPPLNQLLPVTDDQRLRITAYRGDITNLGDGFRVVVYRCVPKCAKPLENTLHARGDRTYLRPLHHFARSEPFPGQLRRR